MQTPNSMFARDFDSLQIGERFLTRTRAVTEADVMSFATLTGDAHPQHTDAAWAAGSRFGERVAHGMLIISLALGLMPLDPERIVALRRIREAVFKAPVGLGEEIAAHARIERLDRVDEQTGVAALRVDIVNQAGRAVVRAQLEVLWCRGER